MWRHATSPRRSTSKRKRRGGRLPRHAIQFGQFSRDFDVDLFAVVKVVAEGSVDFGGSEVGVLTDDFLGGPAVAEMIGDDLRDADARETIQPRGFTGGFVNVRIVEDGHTRWIIARAYGFGAGAGAVP